MLFDLYTNFFNSSQSGREVWQNESCAGKQYSSCLSASYELTAYNILL